MPCVLFTQILSAGSAVAVLAAIVQYDAVSRDSMHCQNPLPKHSTRHELPCIKLQDTIKHIGAWTDTPQPVAGL